MILTVVNVLLIGNIVQQAAVFFGGAPGAAVTLDIKIILHYQFFQLLSKSNAILRRPSAIPGNTGFKSY